MALEAIAGAIAAGASLLALGLWAGRATRPRASEPGGAPLPRVRGEAGRERERRVRACVAVADATSDDFARRRLHYALRDAGVERIEPAPGERFDAGRHRIDSTAP